MVERQCRRKGSQHPSEGFLNRNAVVDWYVPRSSDGKWPQVQGQAATQSVETATALSTNLALWRTCLKFPHRDGVEPLHSLHIFKRIGAWTP